MTTRKARSSTARALSNEELAAVAGGQQIITHLFPGQHQPVSGPPKSIAAGEINENSTDDNLPD